MRTIRFAFLILSLLGASAGARAEVTDCTEITVLPFFITSGGIYCLKRDLDGSGGIWVQASAVIIDLNGHVMEGTAMGVASGGATDITVRNGTIRGGTFAVSLSGGSGHLVERIRAEGVGMRVAGHGSVVRDNVVIGTSDADIGIRYGIEVSGGTGIRVSNNQVVNPGSSLLSETGGYRVFDTVGAVIENNMVSSTALIQQGPSFGINVMFSSGTVVSGNRVANMKVGIHQQFGGSAVFVDNTVFGATQAPYSGGTMVGTTNVSF